MKKVISILIIAVMLIAGLFVLTGCGNMKQQQVEAQVVVVISQLRGLQ